MKQKLLSLKNLLFKPAVSAIVFISFILIGGLIIVARQSNPTALDNLKAGANNNMLTATNWDALIDYVKGLEGDIYTKIIDIQTQATNLWNKDGNNIYYNSGSVSIGNNVSIGGSIKIGNTTDSCSSSNAGSMKYANGCMSYCNSTERKEISCPVVCTISPTFTYVGQNFVITDCTATYTIADRNV
ncbi:MAG: hypothetical protein LBU27_07765 [Candidatus Peribacteria bacterium]|jgi:hypothetical protein|nr:hypothetical protein [Candidatus Peribacteria bacterium]